MGVSRGCEQVQRLRAEVVEAGEAAEQLQAAKATLVNEKLKLAHALQRSTGALAGALCRSASPLSSVLWLTVPFGSRHSSWGQGCSQPGSREPSRRPGFLFRYHNTVIWCRICIEQLW